MKSHSHSVHIEPHRLLEAAVQQHDNTLFFHVYKHFEVRNRLADCDKYVLLAKQLFARNKQLDKGLQ